MQEIIQDQLDKFRKQFVKETPFGVAIGAIDNLRKTGLQQIDDFITESMTLAIEAERERMREALEEVFQVKADDALVQKIAKDIFKRI